MRSQFKDGGRGGGEDYVPDVVAPQLTAALQSGVVQALAHRERWRAEITGFMLMIVNGNRAERAVAFSATILTGHIRRWWILDEAGQRYFRD